MLPSESCGKQQPRLTLRLERIDHPGQPGDRHAEHFEGRVARRAVAADLEVGVLGLDRPGVALAGLAATRREAPLLEAVGLPAGLGDLRSRHAELARPGPRAARRRARPCIVTMSNSAKLVTRVSAPSRKLHVAARDTSLRRIAEGDPVGRERAIALSDLDGAVGDVEVAGAIVFDGVRGQLEGLVAGVELDVAQDRPRGPARPTRCTRSTPPRRAATRSPCARRTQRHAIRRVPDGSNARWRAGASGTQAGASRQPESPSRSGAIRQSSTS